MDHIHTINQVIEKCAEYTQTLYIAFIDYEKAFDSVETLTVIQALRNQGVGEHYVRILEDIYNGSTATIILHKESSKIPIRKGVRQGDNLSNLIYNLFKRSIKSIGFEQVGVRVNEEYLSPLTFADDIAFEGSNSGEELKSMLTAQDRGEPWA